MMMMMMIEVEDDQKGVFKGLPVSYYRHHLKGDFVPNTIVIIRIIRVMEYYITHYNHACYPRVPAQRDGVLLRGADERIHCLELCPTLQVGGVLFLDE